MSIARGNEEIYESDYVESMIPAGISCNNETAERSYDLKGDGVEFQSIRPENAFEVFRGKIYGPERVEYSLADAIEKKVESPLQRFARLRAEVEELQSDLEVMNVKVPQ